VFGFIGFIAILFCNLLTVRFRAKYTLEKMKKLKSKNQCNLFISEWILSHSGDAFFFSLQILNEKERKEFNARSDWFQFEVDLQCKMDCLWTEALNE